jgi:hypothetical protein
LQGNGFFQRRFLSLSGGKEAGGLEALFDVSRRKPNIKNRVDGQTGQAVMDFAIALPAMTSYGPAMS